MTPTGPPAVAWVDVRKAYPDGQEALRGVSLTVARGESLALLGPSGSGKTTLLKLVNRLAEPTAGTVEVAGASVAGLDPIALRRSIGYVIQEVGLMPHLDVLANVALGLRLRGVGRADRDGRAAAWLEKVGLPPATFARRLPHQLSGGQRQRVGVARAFATEPTVVLMDEPFGALDPVLRRDLGDEFRDLQRRLGTTVVIVTHDAPEALRLADRLALMERGSLVQHGTADDLLNRPASTFVASFFEGALR